MTFHNVRAEEAKNGRGRPVPLTKAVTDLIPILEAQSAGGRWFPFKPGAVWQWWDYIRDDMAKAGMPVDDVVLHTMRHTCASRLRRRGVALDHIKNWLGHASIEITIQRYVHVSGADIAAAAGLASDSSSRTNPSTESSKGENPIATVSRTNRDELGMAQLQ